MPMIFCPVSLVQLKLARRLQNSNPVLLLVWLLSLIAACHLIVWLYRALVPPALSCPDETVRGEQALEAIKRSKLIKDLGNWTFDEPDWLSSVCRGQLKVGPRDSTTSKRAEMSDGVNEGQPRSAEPSHRSRRLLAIVPVTADMTSARQDLRQTWGDQLNNHFGQLLFLVQLSSDFSLPSNLVREKAEFQDLLIAYHSGENSEDSYHLLVRKMLAGLRWYADRCSRGFDFVLKADFDSYWHVSSLAAVLRDLEPSESIVLGSVQENAVARRSENSKFYVSEEAYPEEKYPMYASGGPGYVLSRAAVLSIVSEAQRHVHQSGALWVEDVYITGILPALSALDVCRQNRSTRRSHPGSFSYLHSDSIFVCSFADLTDDNLSRWPPLAMHKVMGGRLRAVHGWMQRSERAAAVERAHLLSVHVRRRGGGCA